MQKLYDRDFYEWANETAAALRDGRISEVDIESVAEEIEGMAHRDLRELISRLSRIYEHKLKLSYLPAWMVERNRRQWTVSIGTQQEGIELLLRQSPSLRRQLDSVRDDAYRRAARIVCQKFDLDVPRECPWTIGEVI